MSTPELSDTPSFVSLAPALASLHSRVGQSLDLSADEFEEHCITAKYRIALVRIAGQLRSQFQDVLFDSIEFNSVTGVYSRILYAMPETMPAVQAALQELLKK